MNDTARNTNVYDALRPELAKLIPPPGHLEGGATSKVGQTSNGSAQIWPCSATCRTL